MVVQYKVYGKDNCPYCVKAIYLLKQYGRPFEYFKLGTDLTHEYFRELFPNAKTVPQIILGDLYIGGYTELEKHCKETW